jgi:signal transduction histidine kinase
MNDRGGVKGERQPKRRESALEKRLTLSDMLDLPTFHEVVRGFSELYQVGIKVFDEEGNKLADIKVGNGDFCGYVFSVQEGRNRCTATVARVKDGPLALSAFVPPPAGGQFQKQGLISVSCFTGLRYLILPIRWEGDELGRIIFGPFTPDDYREFPATLMDIPGLDRRTLSAHLQKIRRAPEAAIARVLIHFAQIVDTLIAAGQRTYLTSQLHIEATLETNRDLEAKNRKLEEMNARLTELDRLKSSFLATVSHELRTPLTSIIGYSEMLAEGLAGPMSEEQTDYVRTIFEKGEALLKLISSILDISQIEAGKVRLSFETLLLSDVVKEALVQATESAKKRGISLETRLPVQPYSVVADREKLRQVVVNLLANAVKFTANGGRVFLTVSDQGYQPELKSDGYRISVDDSGVGIPQDQFDRIFQSFYQVDSSSTREFGGAGLGLSIVKSFVEAHGGLVRVLSEVGRGSTFVAILPSSPQVHAASAHSPGPSTESDRF